jgi:lipoate-protein ligase A
LVAGTATTGARRLIRVVDATEPAVVLGSAQPDSDVDLSAAEEAGIEVTRRRSGGGAVLVGPDEALWVDVVVPADDPLWQDDVGRATWWVGECWAGALRQVTGRPAEVWKGPLVKTIWSPKICFAGLGPGEVTLDGVKVVGVSQRRTRRGALLQCAALLRWRPEAIIGILALSPTDRRQAALDVSSVAAGLGPIAGPLLDAFVAQVQAAAPTPTPEGP